MYMYVCMYVYIYIYIYAHMFYHFGVCLMFPKIAQRREVRPRRRLLEAPRLALGRLLVKYNRVQYSIF